MTDELRPLSKKHQRLLDEYLLSFNATKAYQRVYPKATYESARALSSKLLADVNFKSHLQARLDEAHMSADEALKLMSEIARGDISEFITPLGALDIDALRESGRGKLIKKIKQRTITKIGKSDKDDDVEVHDTEIEFYDAQAAQRDILKLHGKFVERVDLSNSDGTLKPPQIIEIIKTYTKDE